MSLSELLNAWSGRSWFGSTPAADEQQGDGRQQPSPYVNIADDLGAGTAQTQQAVGGATTSSSKRTKQRGCCGTGLFSRCVVVDPSEGEKSFTSSFRDWFSRKHTDAKSTPEASESDEEIWNHDAEASDWGPSDSESDGRSSFDGETGIEMSPPQHGHESKMPHPTQADIAMRPRDTSSSWKPVVYDAPNQERGSGYIMSSFGGTDSKYIHLEEATS